MALVFLAVEDELVSIIQLLVAQLAGHRVGASAVPTVGALLSSLQVELVLLVHSLSVAWLPPLS